MKKWQKWQKNWYFTKGSVTGAPLLAPLPSFGRLPHPPLCASQFPPCPSSIIPLHPSKSPCFIPTNRTPWPTTSSAPMPCDPVPTVVSLAAAPKFLGCFSFSCSFPSKAPLVSKHGGCRQPMCDPEGCATVLGVARGGTPNPHPRGQPLNPLVEPNLGGRRAGWPAAGLPGGGGGSVGTPTYIPQNDPHETLIILNVHNWGRKIFQKNLPINLGSHQPRSGPEVGLGSKYFFVFLTSF